jgi:hypothetical protein
MNAPPILNHLDEGEYVLRISFFDVEGNAYKQDLHMNHGKRIPDPVKSKA